MKDCPQGLHLNLVLKYTREPVQTSPDRQGLPSRRRRGSEAARDSEGKNESVGKEGPIIIQQISSSFFFFLPPLTRTLCHSLGCSKQDGGTAVGIAREMHQPAPTTNNNHEVHSCCWRMLGENDRQGLA